MRATTLTVPRLLALLGAALIAAASLLPWNRYDAITTSAGGSAARIHGAVDLWSVDPAAGALVAGAALGAVLLVLSAGHHLRAARYVAGALGLAIAAYAFLHWFDDPALASVMASHGRPADVVSGGASVDTGIFLMLVGGAALVLSAVESADS